MVGQPFVQGILSLLLFALAGRIARRLRNLGTGNRWNAVTILLTLLLIYQVFSLAVLSFISTITLPPIPIEAAATALALLMIVGFGQLQDMVTSRLQGNQERDEIQQNVEKEVQKRTQEILQSGEEHFKLVMEQSPLPFELYDTSGIMVFANEAWAQLWGIHSPKSMMGEYNVLEDEQAQNLGYSDGFKKALQGQFVDIPEACYNPKEHHNPSRKRYLHSRIYPLQGRSGKIKYVSITHFDITEQKHSELQLLKNEQQLKATNERLRRSINELEKRNREIALLNQMIELLQACRYAEETYAILNMTLEKIFPEDSGVIHLYDQTHQRAEIVSNWGNNSNYLRGFSKLDCWALRRSKPHMVDKVEIAPVCAHLNPPPTYGYVSLPLQVENNTIGVLHMFFSGGDGRSEQSHLRDIHSKQNLLTTITEQFSLVFSNLKMRERLRSQSIRDPLTNLYNRRYLEETLDREERRASRQQGSLAILMIDIDHFKDFNDRFGHKAGDDILVGLSERLQMNIRGEDIACRYGGEEFVLILPGASQENAIHRAEQIRRDVSDNLNISTDGHSLHTITVSLGVAIYPDHAQNIQDVLKEADKALYVSKNQGRNAITVATC